MNGWKGTDGNERTEKSGRNGTEETEERNERNEKNEGTGGWKGKERRISLVVAVRQFVRCADFQLLAQRCVQPVLPGDGPLRCENWRFQRLQHSGPQRRVEREQPALARKKLNHTLLHGRGER